MSGARPDSETARRMGIVPHNGASNGGTNNDGSVNNGSVPYPNVSSNKSGNFAGNPAPENVKSSKQGGTNGGGNQQLWPNVSGNYNQGSAPAWPGNNQQSVPNSSQRGVPVNPSNSFDSQKTASAGPMGDRSVGGGYIQGPQPVNGSGAPRGAQQQQQQQQQQQNWQGKSVTQGVPVSNQPGGYVQGGPQQNGFQQPNSQVPQAGALTGGPKGGLMPKGDYVYYDGNGNQIQPGTGGPQGPNGSGHWEGSGNERHYHHHYYHNAAPQQQQQQGPPTAYPYDKTKEQKRKRKPGATALAAALIACWACTCCCHAPCGC